MVSQMLKDDLIRLIKLLESGESEPEYARIFKTEPAEQKFWAVVLEPMSDTGPGGIGDAHGHLMTEEEIQKSMHNFMLNGGQIFKDHKGAVEAKIFEVFCAPVQYEVDGEVIKKGSWVMGTKVYNTELWKGVESGEYGYYSPGGYGTLEDLT
jgi:hypothetical protein